MESLSDRIVCFQVQDHCNYSCKGCHWLSEKVRPIHPPFSAEDISSFLKRTGPYMRAVFSGGEPTLWKDLARTVNSIPNEVSETAIYTNGSILETLEGIANPRLYVRLSVHRQTNWSNVEQILHLAQERSWRIKLYGFDTDFEEAKIPSWFNNHITVRPDQRNVGQMQYANLLGRKVRCYPRMLFVGTDGCGYRCEIGLRSKTNTLREDYDLWSGVAQSPERECMATEACLSCFVSEQYVR